jgi:hypothetical protein
VVERSVKFVTADRVLVDQLRHRKIRYALDLVEIGENAANGENVVEIGTRPPQEH